MGRYLYHCSKLRYAQTCYYHNRQHMDDGEPRVEGTGQSEARPPGALIAIMAGNRLVTTETGNVSIRSTIESNAYDFASRAMIVARRLAVATRLDAIVTAKGKLPRIISERERVK